MRIPLYKNTLKNFYKTNHPTNWGENGMTKITDFTWYQSKLQN